ncbi:MAG TPA: tetratricopeptide repeat protein [Lacunisphaera sp.]|nr:tetratricopeptide repeat protein [Lacunisphaera sp.]
MKRPLRPVPSSGVAAAPSGPANWSAGAVFVLILAATLAAYFPALAGAMLWDDAGHVTSPALQSWAGLGRIWFEPGVTQQYYPLLHSAFWLEHRLWGDATLGYHLANVIEHALSAWLFALFLRRIALPGAMLAALIFALHPVAVESVAWISEQKNTLSTVFYLAAALAWLRFEDDRRPARYALATGWFVVALLTKTVTATLPGALLVLAWWRRGRLSWRGDVIPLLPWLALGLAAGLGTSWLERAQIGATGGDFALGPLARALLAGRVVWFYLGKLLWPAGLAFFYPRWAVDPGVPWQWLFPAAALAVLAAAAGWSRRDRGPLAAGLLFGGTLFPVLGFVNVYPFVFSYVADHFQYLASLAIIAFLTAAAVRGFALLAWPRWSSRVVAPALLCLLGALTWRQCHMYRDPLALYETTLARNPASWVAQLNLGTALDEAGQTEAALPHLQRALALKPDFPETLNSLGNVLNRLGRPAEALPLVERAVQLQPKFALAHNTRGVALMALGSTAEGTAAFARAVELDSALPLAHVNLAWALANQNRIDEALTQFETAARLQPDAADLDFKWGLVLAQAGRLADAVAHLQRAVTQQPDDPARHFLLGRALWSAGRRPEAVAQFEETLRLDPSHAGAREVLDAIHAGGPGR